jgi:hypothetical protein
MGRTPLAADIGICVFLSNAIAANRKAGNRE